MSDSCNKHHLTGIGRGKKCPGCFVESHTGLLASLRKKRPDFSQVEEDPIIGSVKGTKALMDYEMFKAENQNRKAVEERKEELTRISNLSDTHPDKISFLAKVGENLARDAEDCFADFEKAGDN